MVYHLIVFFFRKRTDAQLHGPVPLGGTDLVSADQIIGHAADRRLHLGAQTPGLGFHVLPAAASHFTGENQVFAGNGTVHRLGGRAGRRSFQ